MTGAKYKVLCFSGTPNPLGGTKLPQRPAQAASQAAACGPPMLHPACSHGRQAGVCSEEGRSRGGREGQQEIKMPSCLQSAKPVSNPSCSWATPSKLHGPQEPGCPVECHCSCVTSRVHNGSYELSFLTRRASPWPTSSTPSHTPNTQQSNQLTRTRAWVKTMQI